MSSLKSYPLREQRFQLMHPMARLALGSLAAMLALLAGTLLFGPVADDRALQLAQGHLVPRVAARASDATLVLASVAPAEDRPVGAPVPAATVAGRRK